MAVVSNDVASLTEHKQGVTVSAITRTARIQGVRNSVAERIEHHKTTPVSSDLATLAEYLLGVRADRTTLAEARQIDTFIEIVELVAYITTVLELIEKRI